MLHKVVTKKRGWKKEKEIAIFMSLSVKIRIFKEKNKYFSITMILFFKDLIKLIKILTQLIFLANCINSGGMLFFLAFSIAWANFEFNSIAGPNSITKIMLYMKFN